MNTFIRLTLLIVCLITLSPTAQAQTPIPDAMAQKFFERCLMGASLNKTMTEQNQKRFCSCTAKNMQKSMTQEDLTALGAKGAPARAALNKVIAEVNAPCSRYPIKDMLNNKCMADLGNTAICTCLSEKMGLYIESESTRLMGPILAANPDIYDPTEPIMSSPEFQETEKKIALGCATNPN